MIALIENNCHDDRSIQSHYPVTSTAVDAENVAFMTPSRVIVSDVVLKLLFKTTVSFAEVIPTVEEVLKSFGSPTVWKYLTGNSHELNIKLKVQICLKYPK